ncbi:hypothetical protein [Rhodonellum psychrophilum]|nr:hypothetical protein [Rhodonellum psychrophilum]
MKIIYIPDSENTDLTKCYQLTNGQNEDIGTVEGFGNKYGELVSVVKIFHPNYQRNGYGFEAFEKIFNEINNVVPITIIKGSWHAGEEFQDFEDNMSTNLKIFKENLKTETIETSAFLTPTGKWAKALGFNNVNIKAFYEDEVLVDFTK